VAEIRPMADAVDDAEASRLLVIERKRCGWVPSAD
jgi:hypothetical protein